MKYLTDAISSLRLQTRLFIYLRARWNENYFIT